MIEIRPFKGVLYNQEKVNPAKVVAPPYDIISPPEQDKFYRLHPGNVIRLILGKKYQGDSGKHNCYTRAASFYNKWLKEKILLVDTAPSIYITRTDFKEDGKKKTRMGFIALASLSRDNRLIPHERTFAGPKRDRLKLIEACHTNFSQIFTLYSDPQRRVEKLLTPFMNKRPFMGVGYKGEKHFIWKLSERETIDRVRNLMRNKNIFIADGHHRYAVARAFGHPFVMLYFSSMDGDGLSILPTHRMVREGALKKDRLEMLGEFFTVIPKKNIADAAKALRKNSRSFGLLSKGERGVKVFILKDKSFITQFIKGRFSLAKKNLSTTILDEGVLKGILRIKDFERNISYTRDAAEARRKIEEGAVSHAFLLPSVSLDELKSIAMLGERMPHKSTFFYPKLISGLVIYDHARSLL